MKARELANSKASIPIHSVVAVTDEGTAHSGR